MIKLRLALLFPSSVLLWLFSLAFFCFSWIALADTTSTVQPPAPIDDPMGITADLTNVQLKFCNPNNTANQEDRLTTSVKPGEPLDICLSLYNNNDKPATVVMWFVDGAYTVDSLQKKSCKSNEFTDRFWQYVSGYADTFSIGPNETITTHATLSLPPSAVGIYHWCLVFSLNPWYSDTSTGQFNVVVRKGHFIDVMVEWPTNSTLSIIEPLNVPRWENISNNPLLYAHRTPMWSVAIVVWLNNHWDLDENVDATLTIKNTLWYVVWVYKQSKIIMNQHQENITFSLDAFPRYKWYFFADLALTHHPIGWVTWVSEDLETLVQSASFFMFPVWAALSVIVLLVLVNLFFSIRRINTSPKTIHSKKRTARHT